MSNLDPANFTHLRVHSQGSLLCSTASVNDLVQRAAAAGMKALALTDHHALYNVVQFDGACRAAGIQSIVGMTIGVVGEENGHPPHNLVLLATGAAGYQSLCRLSACLQAAPDRESRLQTGLSWDDLKAYNDGLIAIEAGLSGQLARHLQAGKRQAAAQYAGRLAAIFTDRCYVG
ncbi:MAG: PHP domain-containing protein, partial [Anaerolineales bacterium]|nr:PHP domain-containing protein [Anaerolineales bacterium]